MKKQNQVNIERAEMRCQETNAFFCSLFLKNKKKNGFTNFV